MDTSLVASFVIALILIATLSSSLRIASENERLALFSMGRFEGFAGPGLIMLTPFATRIVRLKIGDIGRVAGDLFVQFNGVDIPIDSASSFDSGASVRISAFDDNGPVLVASNVPASQICPKCGHQF